MVSSRVLLVASTVLSAVACWNATGHLPEGPPPEYEDPPPPGSLSPARGGHPVDASSPTPPAPQPPPSAAPRS